MNYGTYIVSTWTFFSILCVFIFVGNFLCAIAIDSFED